MTVLIVLLIGFVIGHMRGWNKGWRAGIKIARHWETAARDWRMLYEMEAAENEEELTAAHEIRQLKKMYDGI